MHRLKEIDILSHSDKNSVALKAFFEITRQWRLTPEQECILLAVPKNTFSRWKKARNGALTQDHLERISYVLGIYKALKILLPNQEAANNWLHKPNSAPLFGGKSALDKLMTGSLIDLADIRRYLDAERGL